MDQPDITKQTIRYYWRHMRKYPRKLLGAFISVPLSVLFLGFVPQLVVSRILQRISSGHYTHGQLWASFGPELLLYAGAVLLSGVVLWRVAVYFIWTLEINVARDIYRDVFDHLMSMSANFHSNRFGGSLVSQTNKLVGAYVMLADAVFFETLTLALAFIFTFAILVPNVPWIATFLIAFALVFIVLSVKISKTVRELRHEEASAETAQTGQLADTITNVMAVKSFAGSGIERKLFAKATGFTEASSHRVMVASTKQDAIFGASTTLAGVIALILAVASMVLFHANVGTAFLVITYSSGIMQRLWDFVRGTLRNYNRGLGDARAMISILAIEPEVRDPEQPEKVRIKQGDIAFDHMSFTHPDTRSGETLFDELNLHIKGGEKIGLVGHSGSGKSTLTRLLLRFSDVDGGAIQIDGQNIANITQDDLRRNIAYVPQEPLLFHRSILENIAYGRPGASKKDIEAAARKAYAGEFIHSLPQGYDTLVGERGVKLSGGQRQRIVIARAILKDAPILVLDEATSALDSESEGLIQKALWELMKDRTAIVIAHRLSTIQKMDRIVVLEQGAIAEEGTHQQLLQQKGTYAKLWAHQSGGFIED